MGRTKHNVVWGSAALTKNGSLRSSESQSWASRAILYLESATMNASSASAKASAARSAPPASPLCVALGGEETAESGGGDRLLSEEGDPWESTWHESDSSDDAAFKCAANDDVLIVVLRLMIRALSSSDLVGLMVPSITRGLGVDEELPSSQFQAGCTAASGLRGNVTEFMCPMSAAYFATCAGMSIPTGSGT